MLNISKIYKMRIVFCVSQTGPARSGTLSMLRTWVLQSGLAYMPAKMNARWPRLSYGPSLGRGQTARREYVDIYLNQPASQAQVTTQLARSKPHAITLLEVRRVPYSLASVQQLAAAVVYTVAGNFAQYNPTQSLEEQVASGRLEIVQQAPNGMRLITPLLPFVRQVRSLHPGEVELTLVPMGDKWMNPLACIYAWLGIEISGPLEELTDEHFNVIREGLYWKDSADNLHLI